MSTIHHPVRSFAAVVFDQSLEAVVASEVAAFREHAEKAAAHIGAAVTDVAVVEKVAAELLDRQIERVVVTSEGARVAAACEAIADSAAFVAFAICLDQRAVLLRSPVGAIDVAVFGLVRVGSRDFARE